MTYPLMDGDWPDAFERKVTPAALSASAAIIAAARRCAETNRTDNAAARMFVAYLDQELADAARISAGRDSQLDQARQAAHETFMRMYQESR